MCGIAGYFNPDQNYAENPKQIDWCNSIEISSGIDKI